MRFLSSPEKIFFCALFPNAPPSNSDWPIRKYLRDKFFKWKINKMFIFLPCCFSEMTPHSFSPQFVPPQPATLTSSTQLSFKRHARTFAYTPWPTPFQFHFEFLNYTLGYSLNLMSSFHIHPDSISPALSFCPNHPLINVHHALYIQQQFHFIYFFCCFQHILDVYFLFI